MSAIKTVALAGANGHVGAIILKTLLENDFTVTVLVRSGSTSTQAYPAEVKLAHVDYAVSSTLHSALSNQDAVVSAIGDVATLTQEALIDAAIAAGVKRIIPSEYGIDPDHAAVRALPVFGQKQRVAEYVRERTSGTPGTTYSLICNNEFLDYGLEHSHGIDVKKRKMDIFDGGEVRLTITPRDVVAKGIVGVLRRPEETANRVVRVHGLGVTQNQLLGIFRRVVGEEGWDIEHVDTVEREKEGWKALSEDPGNFMKWAMPFFQVCSYAERFGGDFSMRNDNELLGVEELTERDIEEMVQKYI